MTLLLFGGKHHRLRIRIKAAIDSTRPVSITQRPNGIWVSQEERDLQGDLYYLGGSLDGCQLLFTCGWPKTCRKRRT